jgi:signal peptidase I
MEYNTAIKSKKEGGKFFPALCNIIGTFILALVIISFIPVAVPEMMGYEIYNVISGSMEPVIPVGSVIYVKYESPVNVVEGDVIAFYSLNSVIAHRVVSNNSGENTFTTKGDANKSSDMNAVDYSSFIGVVKYHFPYAGALMELYTSSRGKLYAICFAAAGAAFNILASLVRNGKKA